MRSEQMTKLTTLENSIVDYSDPRPYGITKGQIWKSNSTYFGDLKILHVQRRSKEMLIVALDLRYDEVRSISAYNLARTGIYSFKTSTH
ncbi:hypothetical protein EVB81_078 [Rhizobium phage RHph_I46]|uniref:Uncharacterized protein n=1 Tax=Rhizobium phage RHph_I1_9 TaxID=2509729 RepID=A0A7S5RJB9_9CAUD|nr:hypothetical protein PP936_gp077 [Rhizobium phage RHph_I1_9]QIG69647.1 hypothetical protein EVB81_078 [Rhizobium phage RHph_I46]QIG70928.1 hypothetical protein EVB92_078 [Rhizobium phage RHph_I9]QIG73514.1 hypothetical protein EVC04_077 [Rhizobium phage RHph_I1_9]QIG76267.1 hypothetical protein EVC25_078 [Rhizobium phage RHph_I34]